MPQLVNPFKRTPREKENAVEQTAAAEHIATTRKPFLVAALPVFACGAGLFSDGYINNVSC